MTRPKEEPAESVTSEQQQDDEAIERFADESPAEDPHFKVTVESDPNESSEEKDDGA
ncbi:MAG TPA: hypothetical protein VMU99_06160 [Acidimicrobiales bacterium]|nr:hypothetical protein [Acidimicrobiales bacterium]